MHKLILFLKQQAFKPENNCVYDIVKIYEA